jgi:hypothetical protein
VTAATYRYELTVDGSWSVEWSDRAQCWLMCGPWHGAPPQPVPAVLVMYVSELLEELAKRGSVTEYSQILASLIMSRDDYDDPALDIGAAAMTVDLAAPAPSERRTFGWRPAPPDYRLKMLSDEWQYDLVLLDERGLGMALEFLRPNVAGSVLDRPGTHGPGRVRHIPVWNLDLLEFRGPHDSERWYLKDDDGFVAAGLNEALDMADRIVDDLCAGDDLDRYERLAPALFTALFPTSCCAEETFIA